MIDGARDIAALPLLADMLGLVLCLCGAVSWVFLAWVVMQVIG